MAADSTLEKQIDWRQLSLRHPREFLTFAVQTTLEHAMREFWRREGFIEIHSPKLMGTFSESGAEAFEVKYFDDRPAFLAQSPQFYKQMAMAAGFERVFEIGPAFRAEPSFTTRHETEFTSIDMELSWIDSREDVMQVEERWLAYSMRRIVVLGCSGSGKTTLAAQIGQRLDLPVICLDPLYWLPGWRVPDTESFLSRVAEALAEDAWVSEGNYRETFPIRLPRADTVIILQCPRWLRLWRVLRRSIFERGKRADLPVGCPEHVDWALLKFIWRFDRTTWPRIDAARVEHGATVPTCWLRSRREINDFLAALPDRAISN
jgi:adenylate kinase family enzyme